MWYQAGSSLARPLLSYAALSAPTQLNVSPQITEICKPCVKWVIHYDAASKRWVLATEEVLQNDSAVPPQSAFSPHIQCLQKATSVYIFQENGELLCKHGPIILGGVPFMRSHIRPICERYPSLFNDVI